MFRETARRVALEIARDYAGVVIRRVGADGDTLEEIEITGEDPR
jgi:hypothetical protein